MVAIIFNGDSFDPINCLAFWLKTEYLRLYPTLTDTGFWRDWYASITAANSSALMAKGFSTKTFLPACNACITCLA